MADQATFAEQAMPYMDQLYSHALRMTRNAADADRAARRIANSMLVKTAIFGGEGLFLATLTGPGRVIVDGDGEEQVLEGR